MNRAKRIVLLVFAVLVLVVALALGLFNSEPVAFHYLAGEVELPLFALLVASAFVALLLAGLASAVPLMRQKRAITKLRKEVDQLQARLNVERQLPQPKH